MQDHRKPENLERKRQKYRKSRGEQKKGRPRHSEAQKSGRAGKSGNRKILKLKIGDQDSANIRNLANIEPEARKIWRTKRQNYRKSGKSWGGQNNIKEISSSSGGTNDGSSDGRGENDDNHDDCSARPL